MLASYANGTRFSYNWSRDKRSHATSKIRFCWYAVFQEWLCFIRRVNCFRFCCVAVTERSTAQQGCLAGNFSRGKHGLPKAAKCILERNRHLYSALSYSLIPQFWKQTGLRSCQFRSVKIDLKHKCSLRFTDKVIVTS